MTASASTPENNPDLAPEDVAKLADKLKNAQTKAKGDAKQARQQYLRSDPSGKTTAKDPDTRASKRKPALRDTSKPKDSKRRATFADDTKDDATAPGKKPRKTVDKAKMEKDVKSAPKRKAAPKCPYLESEESDSSEISC